MMKYKVFYKNFFVILIIDIFLLAVALFISNLIRFDFNIPVNYIQLFYYVLPFILIIKALCFFSFYL
jgi:hypothetical protein